MPRPTAMTRLLGKRLLVVTGKGGVGKSTVSAALALELARSGRRTLLCEVNGGGRAAALLGHPPAGPELGHLEGELWSVDVRPAEAMREYVLQKIRFERVYRAVFENPLVRSFLRFIPSLPETVMLGKIVWHLRQREGGRPVWDAVVMDAPATGHALSFLGVPEVLLQTLPPGTMAEEVTWMHQHLVDPDITGAAVVSLPEELPIVETLELGTGLRALHLALDAVVLNQATRPRFVPGDLAALAGAPRLRALAASHVEEAGRTQSAADRLSSLDVPVIELPRLYQAGMDRAGVEILGRALLSGLAGGT
ncbi:MAG TPA: ArsA-related P-loop ATPase [Myxococcaceae bacterium]|nr:ArsA-related P-loop ATPase [Myxococcaceae bacterium]